MAKSNVKESESSLYRASTQAIGKELQEFEKAVSNYIHDLAVFDGTVPQSKLIEITNAAENLIEVLQEQIRLSWELCQKRLENQ